MVPLSILQNDLILPIITPRFALSCDMKLMERLGQLAARYDVHIQVIYFIIQYIHILFHKFYFHMCPTVSPEILIWFKVICLHMLPSVSFRNYFCQTSRGPDIS
jgi:hypothetical protein